MHLITMAPRRQTSRLSYFVKIMSAPMSFPSCADGAMVPGKASILTDASRPQCLVGGCQSEPTKDQSISPLERNLAEKVVRPDGRSAKFSATAGGLRIMGLANA